MKIEHYLYIKINSKWTEDLNVRPDTIKLLQEKYSDINHLFGSTSQSKENKNKNKWDLIKLQSFCTARQKDSLQNRTYLQMKQ